MDRIRDPTCQTPAKPMRHCNQVGVKSVIFLNIFTPNENPQFLGQITRTTCIITPTVD